jgi:hypothetical protein
VVPDDGAALIVAFVAIVNPVGRVRMQELA